MNIKPYIRTPHFYETDQMGIIHHSNYIRWFEEARVDLMEQMGFGYEKAVAAGIDFAVLGVSCEYKSMVRFGDTVEILCELQSIEAMRMTLGYTITDSATGQVRTTGSSGHCFFSRSRQRPVSVKRDLPEFYELARVMCDGE